MPVSADVIFSPSFSNFDFGIWNGQGDVSISQTACIISFSGNITNRRNYRMRARMNLPAPSTATPFQLYNTINSTYSVPATVDVRDLHAGSGIVSLIADSFSNTMTYQGCIFGAGGPNAELTMSIQAANLYQVPAGLYQLSMDIEARRANNSGGLTNDGATQSGLLGTIAIPSLVQVSRMDNINLGTYDGISPIISYNEPFCIYTNTSSYTLTPSSTTSGAGVGSFALDSSGNRLEYTVRVNNSADASLGTQLTNGQTSPSMIANQTTPLSVNCNAIDNAAVYLEFTGTQLQSAPPGNYSAVLNLMVSPI